MFIIKPFGVSGDLTAIPINADPSGFVSFDQGYGFDYSRDPATDTLAKDIERAKLNYILNIITGELRQYQTTGTPLFITSADNGGSAFPYALGARVRYTDGLTYESRIDSNTDLPSVASSWAVVRASSGDTAKEQYFCLTSAPTGWLVQDGRTIGSAGSGATARANADTFALYSALWLNWSNSVLAIQNSSGVPTARGADAATDFAANKRLPLFDKRGYFQRASGTNGDGTVGGTPGTLVADSFAAHTHTFNRTADGAGGTGGDTGNGAWTGVRTTNSTGGTETAPRHIPSILCIGL